jgi:NADH-quinone oxidoreductase subunit G
MPRPRHEPIRFSIDGREVQAPENLMLVDAAKHGDVEIPVFCYEPKLGHPVGACRMCLVEIEGIPKLQTACSTPVKDGMVVHTHTEHVREAQEAVVEFLLVNHPLDCPVCDRGGECPLQDIAFGWGPGRSRFIEPKRHFVKPVELSPLIAIDRERCILCYRCVRFSQEVAEDHQLALLDRGAHSYVSTFDGHPYVGPFSGNVIELCPVGALTSVPYRFRARPWEIEGSASICTLCPSQCNVELTVRDERVLRVLARQNDDVDDGWLCDKGRFAYQAIHVDERVTAPLLREGGELREVSWERALDHAAGALGRAGARTGALAGGATTNEEAFLLGRLVREALGSPHVDSRGAATLPAGLHRALSDPRRQATVPDLEFAHAVLVLDCEPVDDAPIIDLRIRKGVRRHGLRLAVATSRPSSLDAGAALSVRFSPGAGGAFVAALVAAVAGRESAELADRAGADAGSVAALGELLRAAEDEDEDAGRREVVIVWGERLAHGPRAEQAVGDLLALADALEVHAAPGAGLLELPVHANGRGMREAGLLPDAGPGLAELAARAPGPGRDSAAIAAGLAEGQLAALYLLHVDPLQALGDRPAWERALAGAATVIAHAQLLTEGLREHADVVFPAEAYPEKEGTVVHPDGRLQRLRPGIAHPGDVRAGWSVLAELARRLGTDLEVRTAGEASARLFDAVPFYSGLTLEQIGGQGLRWPEREAAAALAGDEGARESSTPAGARSRRAASDEAPAPAAAAANGALHLDSYRSLWSAPEVQASPSLAFLHPEQRAEISPADAERLGLREGQRVRVRAPANGDGAEDEGAEPREVQATVALRQALTPGVVLLQDGLERDSANALGEPGSAVEVRPA